VQGGAQNTGFAATFVYTEGPDRGIKKKERKGDGMPSRRRQRLQPKERLQNGGRRLGGWLEKRWGHRVAWEGRYGGTRIGETNQVIAGDPKERKQNTAAPKCRTRKGYNRGKKSSAKTDRKGKPEKKEPVCLLSIEMRRGSNPLCNICEEGERCRPG